MPGTTIPTPARLSGYAWRAQRDRAGSPVFRWASSTAATVGGEAPVPERAREAVETETPAAAATSLSRTGLRGGIDPTPCEAMCPVCHPRRFDEYRAECPRSYNGNSSTTPLGVYS